MGERQGGCDVIHESSPEVQKAEFPLLPSLLTFWTRDFLVVGVVICIVYCLSAFSLEQQCCSLTPPPRCVYQKCLQTQSNILQGSGGRKIALVENHWYEGLAVTLKYHTVLKEEFHPGKSRAPGHTLSRPVRVCVSARSVAQSHLTLCDPMDCNLLGSSVHGIL